MLKIVELETGTGQPVTAQLHQMQQRHINDFEGLWRDVLQDLEQDDAFWDWTRKKRLSILSDRYEAYAIEFEDLTQGLLWIETQWHRSWINPQHHLVYIEALASAPWNRKALENPPYLKGVGTTLLLFARRRSYELGYNGRVGLHALPESEEFYDRRNMSDYGQDPDKEFLRYFEYDQFNRPPID